MKTEKHSLDEILNSQEPVNLIEGSVREILARLNKCPACTSNLHFKHITDFGSNTTRELARCPECEYRSKDVLHKLQ